MKDAIEVKNIAVSKTARYYLLGKKNNSLKEIWFVCHGYGYLAKYFIKEFDVLSGSSRLIVAPEGLNRFYKNGLDGRVGASWMTKESRLNEISDYVNYLDTVYNEVLDGLAVENLTVKVLGFSQGAAAVCRWLCMGRAKADHIIIWAGAIPDDLDFNTLNILLNGRSLNLVIGKKDEFISKELLKEHLNFLKKKNVNYNIVSYNGGHEIDAGVLIHLAGQG